MLLSTFGSTMHNTSDTCADLGKTQPHFINDSTGQRQTHEDLVTAVCILKACICKCNECYTVVCF